MKHLCFGLFICLLGIEYSYGWVNNMNGKYAKQSFVPARAILVIIAYAQMPLTNDHVAVSRGLNDVFFVYTQTFCTRAAKALTSQRICN